MASFQFELVSPERLLLSEQTDMVIVPGTEGDFGVLAGHAPVMSTIRPGILTVGSGADAKEFVLMGGFAEVGPDRLTVLAEEACEKSAVDQKALDQQLQDAREDITDAKDDEARAKAQERFDHLSQLKLLL